MSICSDCGKEVEIGQWPWCPHGELYEQNARNFDPIRLHVSDTDPNNIQYPGRNDELPPSGYHSVDITNIREADQWTRRINAVEREKMMTERLMHKAYFDEQLQRRRADRLAKVRGNHKAEMLLRAAAEMVDRKREMKYHNIDKSDPKFHIQALSFDSGNRNSYSGEDTGWRERKR